MVSVTITPEAQAQVDRLPLVIRARMHRLFERLEKWPEVSGVRALSGDLSGWYRLRTGDYRLRFHVSGDTIVVDRVGHRSDVYED